MAQNIKHFFGDLLLIRVNYFQGGFLFKSKIQLETIPQAIDEGSFNFFSRSEIDALAIPETDRTLLWPYYDSHSNGFIGIRANCNPNNQLELTEEISLL